jgi:hypothetical protein
VIGADLKSGGHDGVSGLTVENFERDKFGVLRVQSAANREQTHQEQRANLASSHFPSRNYQVE